jgi:hypothetical protein
VWQCYWYRVAAAKTSPFFLSKMLYISARYYCCGFDTFSSFQLSVFLVEWLKYALFEYCWMTLWIFCRLFSLSVKCRLHYLWHKISFIRSSDIRFFTWGPYSDLNGMTQTCQTDGHINMCGCFKTKNITSVCSMLNSADGKLQLPLPSINRLNETESTTFFKLSWAFCRNSVSILICTCINVNLYAFIYWFCMVHIWFHASMYYKSYSNFLIFHFIIIYV